MTADMGTGRGGGRGCRAWLQVAIAAALLVAIPRLAAEVRPAARGLTQRAYLWNRVWTPALCRSVTAHANAFSALDVLAAELSFNRPTPITVTMRPNWAVLHAAGRPVALVVRIGPCQSSWGPGAVETKAVVGACRRVLAEARANGIEPVELQLDYDAATARLTDYLHLIDAVRREVAPPRLTITTLPTWLTSPDFRALIAAADGYVLQVHSLDKPASVVAAFTLCDPERAARWIEQASALGPPFRIALPAYGYRIGFSASGAFLGLEADGPARAWPPGATVRTVLADPVQLARLVARLTTTPPASCEGLAWFRLPTEGGELAWRWPTLAAVIAGDEPNPKMVVRIMPSQDGTLDLMLGNEGEADGAASIVSVHWHGAQLIAADAIRDWRVSRTTANALLFESVADHSAVALPPGGTRAIGWLRLDAPVTVAATAQ